MLLNNNWVTFLFIFLFFRESRWKFICVHISLLYRILEKMHLLYIFASGRGVFSLSGMVFVTLFGSICVSLWPKKGIAKIESSGKEDIVNRGTRVVKKKG